MLSIVLHPKEVSVHVRAPPYRSSTLALLAHHLLTLPLSFPPHTNHLCRFVFLVVVHFVVPAANHQPLHLKCHHSSQVNQETVFHFSASRCMWWKGFSRSSLTIVSANQHFISIYSHLSFSAFPLETHLITISPEIVLRSHVLIWVFNSVLQRRHVAPVDPMFLPQIPGIEGTKDNAGDHDAVNNQLQVLLHLAIEAPL